MRYPYSLSANEVAVKNGFVRWCSDGEAWAGGKLTDSSCSLKVIAIARNAAGRETSRAERTCASRYWPTYSTKFDGMTGIERVDIELYSGNQVVRTTCTRSGNCHPG